MADNNGGVADDAKGLKLHRTTIPWSSETRIQSSALPKPMTRVAVMLHLHKTVRIGGDLSSGLRLGTGRSALTIYNAQAKHDCRRFGPCFRAFRVRTPTSVSTSGETTLGAIVNNGDADSNAGGASLSEFKRLVR